MKLNTVQSVLFRQLRQVADERTSSARLASVRPAIPGRGRPMRGSVMLALISIYLVWGSTYLSCRPCHPCSSRA
jgi:hypothetical protein